MLAYRKCPFAFISPRAASPSLMLRFLALAAAALFSAGCGYVGEPLPPVLHIPQRVTDLTAVQRGAEIQAAFTLPTHTTEGLVIGRPVTFELRVGRPPEPFVVDAWAAAARPFTGTPSGKPTVHYSLPAADWTGQVVVISVKIVGLNGRDA